MQQTEPERPPTDRLLCLFDRRVSAGAPLVCLDVVGIEEIVVADVKSTAADDRVSPRGAFALVGNLELADQLVPCGRRLEKADSIRAIATAQGGATIKRLGGQIPR